MQQSEELDEELLKTYTENFLGYGSHASPYWFVGIEEGGGRSPGEVRCRLTTWHSRGERELENLAEFSMSIGQSQWFGDDAKIQPTWGKYVWAIIRATGRIPNKETVRHYQASDLGRPERAETCLMNLFPLASPRLKLWLLKDQSRVPWILSRPAYMEYHGPKRAKKIGDYVRKCKPRSVVLASMGARCREHWRTIAGVELRSHSLAGRPCYVGRNDSTVFVVSQNPTSPGATNEYFQAIGEYIATHSIRHEMGAV